MEERAERKSTVRRSSAPPEGNDEFAVCGFATAEDLVRQFVDGFYYGCEADDPVNAWAFKRDHLSHGVQLNTLFGSDIGHFDVHDMAGVLTEAHELLEFPLSFMPIRGEPKSLIQYVLAGIQSVGHAAFYVHEKNLGLGDRPIGALERTTAIDDSNTTGRFDGP